MDERPGTEDDRPDGRPTPAPGSRGDAPAGGGDIEAAVPPPAQVPPPARVPPPPAQVPPPPGEVSTAPHPGPPSRGNLRRNLLIAAVAGIAVLAGLAAYILFALRGTKDLLVDMVPSSATVYVTAYLDPAADQKVKVKNLVGRFPAMESTDHLNRRLDEMLNEALSPTGLTTADVRPWLGSQVGLAVRFDSVQEPLTAVLIRSKDDADARAALDKFRKGPVGSLAVWKDEQYGGVPISTASGSDIGGYGLVDHTVVLASDAKLLRDIVDTQQGKIEDLGSSESFTDAVGPLPSARLGLVYLNFRPLVRTLRSALEASAETAALPGLDQLDALTGMAGTVSARSDGVAAELTVMLDRSKLTSEQQQVFAEGEHENPALAFTPSSAYGVFAATGFRASMEAFVDQASQADPSFEETDLELGLSDAIRHLSGDTAIEVRPGTAGIPGGAWLIGTDDETSMRRLLDRAATMLGTTLADPSSGTSASVRHETYRGVDIAILEADDPDLRSLGIQPAYAVTEGMAIIGSSPEEVKASLDAKATGPSIAAGERFQEALAQAPGDQRVLMYVDVQSIAAAIRGALDPDAQQEFDREVSPNLTPVKRFILNTENEANRTTVRIFVLIR